MVSFSHSQDNNNGPANGISDNVVRNRPAPLCIAVPVPPDPAEMLMVVASAFEPESVGLSVPVYCGMLACVEMAR